MKRILFLAMSVVLVFTLVACKTASISNESIEKAEIELENKNYEKAISLLDIALDDEKLENREEISKLKKIIEDYLLALEYYEQDDLELSQSILDNIDENYKKYSIKEDIDSLKEAISSREKEISKLKQLEDFEALVDNDKIRDAREYYEDIVDENFTEEEEKELEKIVSRLIKKEDEGRVKIKSKDEKTKKVYTGEDSWKNYNHKRPDYVNKKIEENKNRSKKYR